MAEERRANQYFSYTGSPEYALENVVIDGKDVIALNLTVNGIGGLSAMPPHGATVTVKTDTIGTGFEIKDLLVKPYTKESSAGVHWYFSKLFWIRSLISYFLPQSLRENVWCLASVLK